MTARLALAQLGAADAQQFQYPATEQSIGAQVCPGHIHLRELDTAVSEYLQRHRRGVKARCNAGLDDMARMCAQLVHWDRRYAWHQLGPSV